MSFNVVVALPVIKGTEGLQVQCTQSGLHLVEHPHVTLFFASDLTKEQVQVVRRIFQDMELPIHERIPALPVNQNPTARLHLQRLMAHEPQAVIPLNNEGIVTERITRLHRKVNERLQAEIGVSHAYHPFFAHTSVANGNTLPPAGKSALNRPLEFGNQLVVWSWPRK